MADDERIISVFCVFLCFLWKVLSVVKKFWKLKDLENVWKFKGCECLLAGQILVGVTIQLIPGEIVVVLSPGLAVLNLRGVGNLGDPMRVPNATCGCCRPWRHRKFSCGTPGRLWTQYCSILYLMRLFFPRYVPVWCEVSVCVFLPADDSYGEGWKRSGQPW